MFNNLALATALSDQCNCSVARLRASSRPSGRPSYLDPYRE